MVGGLFYPIHQTGADLLNEAKASLTDKNPILAREKRGWGAGWVRKVGDMDERMKRSPEPKSRATVTQHQTLPSQMSDYFKFYPQQLRVASVFNGSSPLFSFYT